MCVRLLLPAQLINILTLGSPQGVGVFFPSGFYGAINKPASYNESLPGLDSFPTSNARVATQVLLHSSCSVVAKDISSSFIAHCG